MTHAPVREAPTVAAAAWKISGSGFLWLTPSEEDNREGKQLVGLGGYQVRTWTAWHRHVTCTMLALAFLVVQRAHYPDPGHLTHPPADAFVKIPDQPGHPGKAQPVTPAPQAS